MVLTLKTSPCIDLKENQQINLALFTHPYYLCRFHPQCYQVIQAYQVHWHLRVGLRRNREIHVGPLLFYTFPLGNSVVCHYWLCLCLFQQSYLAVLHPFYLVPLDVLPLVANFMFFACLFPPFVVLFVSCV